MDDQEAPSPEKGAGPTEHKERKQQTVRFPGFADLMAHAATSNREARLRSLRDSRDRTPARLVLVVLPADPDAAD
jgi:hypothetical protein